MIFCLTVGVGVGVGACVGAVVGVGWLATVGVTELSCIPWIVPAMAALPTNPTTNKIRIPTTIFAGNDAARYHRQKRVIRPGWRGGIGGGGAKLPGAG